MVIGEMGYQIEATYLWEHFIKERNVHFLTLSHQPSEKWFVRSFGIIDGWLVALVGKESDSSTQQPRVLLTPSESLCPHTHKEFEVSGTD